MKRKDILVSRLDALVENKELLALVDGYLDTVPEVFWTAPASSSGNFHPEFDLGDGGTFRHKLVALAFGRDLCRFYDATTDQGEAAMCAIAIHDTYKGGPGPEWTETVKDHGEQAAQAWMNFCASQDVVFGHELFPQVLAIADAVHMHMGIWGRGVYTNDDMETVDRIVAMADFVSTRKILNPGAIDDLLIGCY